MGGSFGPLKDKIFKHLSKKMKEKEKEGIMAQIQISMGQLLAHAHKNYSKIDKPDPKKSCILSYSQHTCLSSIHVKLASNRMQNLFKSYGS